MDSSNIQFAEARDWQDIMKNRSRLKMHELIERLGLRAKWSSNKRGKTNFDSPLVRDLVTDMTNIVATLPRDTEELIIELAKPNSLRTEVEGLLNKHGSAIWGRMGDREHLVSASEEGVEPFYYARDLYFEQEEDRQLIRMLLHWWIGLKACNVILARDRLDRERRKKEERLRARDDRASPREPNPTVAIAPAVRSEITNEQGSVKIEGSAAPFNQAPPHVQALRLDTSYSNPISPASANSLHSNDSPIYSAQSLNTNFSHNLAPRDANSLRRPSALSQSVSAQLGADLEVARHTSTPPLPSLQQLSLELGNLVSNFMEESSAVHARILHTPSPAPPEETLPKRRVSRGLDAESLRAFRSYIYPEEEGPRWEEDFLLRHLETVWRDTVRNYNRTGSTQLFIARDRAFLTWIELRRHLADLDRANKRWRQEVKSDKEIDARIAQHKTLMSASRDLVRSWEDIGQGLTFDWAPAGLTADDLLVQAFVLVAGEGGTDLIWTAMDVNTTVRWLKDHLEQFAMDEADAEERLLYVRT